MSLPFPHSLACSARLCSPHFAHSLITLLLSIRETIKSGRSFAISAEFHYHSRSPFISGFTAQCMSYCQRPYPGFHSFIASRGVARSTFTIHASPIQIWTQRRLVNGALRGAPHNDSADPVSRAFHLSRDLIKPRDDDDPGGERVGGYERVQRKRGNGNERAGNSRRVVRSGILLVSNRDQMKISSNPRESHASPTN